MFYCSNASLAYLSTYSLALVLPMAFPYSVKTLILKILQAKSPDNKYKFAILALSLIMIFLSFILFKSPFLLLLFMIFVGSTPTLALVPNKWRAATYTQQFLHMIIYFLLQSRTLKYFFFIYEFWYECLTDKGFKVFAFLLHLLIFFYMIVTRYIIYFRIEHIPISVSLQILYTLGCFFLFLRFITNFSFFIIPYTFLHYPQYAQILLTEIPDMPDMPDVETNPRNTNPPSNTKPPSDLPKPFFHRLFSFHKHKHQHHHHHYPPHIPRSNFYRNCGLGLATVTVGLSAYACYYYQLSAHAALKQADAAIKQADAAIKQADAAIKQNDLTAYQAGLISKEEYYKRQPQDKS